MIEPLRHTGSTAWMQERFGENANAIYQKLAALLVAAYRFIAALSLALCFQLMLSFYLPLAALSAGTISVGDIVLFNMLLLQ